MLKSGSNLMLRVVKSAAALILVVQLGGAAVNAQGRGRQAAGRVARARGTRESRRAGGTWSATLVGGGGNSSPSGEQIWSGDAQVAMSGNANPIIRVYLALGGSCTVEFPARDPYFVIHPPQPKPSYVVVENSPTKLTDRYFIFRPGDDFVVPPQPVAEGKRAGARQPIATINVQMRSGLFYTIVVYPTRDLSLSTHHILLKYDPNEVVAARRASGLAVYPTNDAAEAKAPPAPATPIRNDDPTRSVPAPDEGVRILRDYAVAAQAELNRFAGLGLSRDAKEVPGLGRFGREVAGLQVAAAETRRLAPNIHLAVVAVRNRRARGVVRLEPMTPVLEVATRNGKGSTAERRQVKSLYVETGSQGGVIGAHGVVYYAIVYELPSALTSRQVLRVSVSEERSVDRPATVEVARD